MSTSLEKYAFYFSWWVPCPTCRRPCSTGTVFKQPILTSLLWLRSFYQVAHLNFLNLVLSSFENILGFLTSEKCVLVLLWIATHYSGESLTSSDEGWLFNYVRTLWVISAAIIRTAKQTAFRVWINHNHYPYFLLLSHVLKQLVPNS